MKRYQRLLGLFGLLGLLWVLPGLVFAHGGDCLLYTSRCV